MASTVRIYNALSDIANKSQKGFITPAVFNSFAYVAQMNVYNELFSDLVDAKKLSRQGFELGRDKSIKKQKLEDLSYFVKKEILSAGNNDFIKPLDLSRIISIKIKDYTQEAGVTENVKFNSCEILYDVEKLNYILGSNLSTPTAEFPVALVSSQIEVFPASVTSLEITYYRIPTSWDHGTNMSQSPFSEMQSHSTLPPFYAVYKFTGAGSGGNSAITEAMFSEAELIDYSSVRDFMMPDHYEPQLIAEMAKLIGLRLRDPNLNSYGSQEDAAE